MVQKNWRIEEKNDKVFKYVAVENRLLVLTRET